MAIAHIALGSNLGDRRKFLARAVEEMNRHEEIRLAQCSSLYRTAPWGVADQPWFLNAAARIETTLAPESLLAALKDIEAIVGRRQTYRWGPREIDLDLLLYDNQILNTPALVIPHPGIALRAFVLRPLLEIAPDLRDPVSGRPWREFWDALPESDQRDVELFAPPLAV